MIKRNLILLVILSAILLPANEVRSYEICDSLRWCIGRTLIFSVSSGKGAHYADVLNNNLLNKISETMTFEMWMKPTKQAGKNQFIGGLWGPGENKNDSWSVYISENDSLTFELNGLFDLRTEDNTIVKIPAGKFYNNWNHFAFVFNGKSGYAYIIVNGSVADSARNSEYPLKRLKQISNSELSIQIGSTNTISNNPDFYRTFLGSMDEIRIWGRALTPAEIYCGKDLALVGKEDSLLVYYRCNDPGYVYTLCDASGHGNSGFMRSGLSANWSDRADIIKVLVNPSEIKDTIYCDKEKIYNFIITDTSVCATGSYLRTYTGSPEKFRLIYNSKETPLINWNYIPLISKTPVSFSIKAKLDFIGTVTSRLEVRNQNSCGWYIANIPISITRLTELSMTKLQVDFDSLKAGCIEKPFIDSVIKICNNTSGSGNARNLTINNISVNFPNVFQLISPALPKVLKPGDCFDITVRFKSGSRSAVYYDTLKVFSDDKCAPISPIPLFGKVKEVIGIYEAGTKTRLDSINFGKTCINFPSEAVEYNWENLIEKDIHIENIIIPANFLGKRFNYPVTLKPITGYMPNYFRFLPKQKGNFIDSIIIVINADGCTIKRPIYIKGIGYDAAISFATPSADFNTIIVGQESVLNVQVNNASDDQLSSSIYLKQGDPFFLTGAKNITVPANSTRTFQLTFRPSLPGAFNDEVCIYENSCFQSFCIPVTGKAITQRFAFLPDIMEVLNVLGCESKDTTLEIKNISGQTQTLSSFNLTPAGSPFLLIEPPALPNSATLNPNETISFKFRYTPNDLTNDRADRAFLYFKTSDGESWSAKLYGTSIVPKLFMTQEILYNTIEVGATQRDTVTLENISLFDILIDSLSVNPGFRIINPSPFSGRLLKPRDSIMVIVDFIPTDDKLYQGSLTVYSSKPCGTINKCFLTGRGIIIPLDAPLKVISYGFVNPCDCQTRTIPLINNSFTFPMSVDSIWIDDVNVTNPAPQFYSWYTSFSPNSIVPYPIPQRGTDTLFIKFCPRRPFIYNLVDNDARIHIKASGSGWNYEFTTYLAGKQTLIIVADTTLMTFSPTRVDTFAKSQYFHLKIPDFEFNPLRSKVKITKLTFQPDERVFYASDSSAGNLPLTIDTTKLLTVKLDFKPRAVRYYEEKFRLEIEAPCIHFDTAVTVIGSGFAPAFGFNLTFSKNYQMVDTFRIVPCDTLEIPIYSSREIPANVLDIYCRLGYDTSKLDYLGAESEYINLPCPNYAPSISHSYSKFGGSEFLLKNFCSPDSVKPLFIAKFFVKSFNRDTFNITVDSIKFDTEDIILYHLIAESDAATIIVQKPELKSLGNADFDSVKVLDCVQRTINLKNIGDVPLNLFSLLNLPPEVKLISSIPQFSDILAVGDTINIILEYCPRKKGNLNQWILTNAFNPCNVFDSTLIKGIGYAPEFPVYFDVSQNFSATDTINVQLGDTITIPLFTEKDFMGVFKGVPVWLEELRFKTDITYNPFSLKFLEARTNINSDFTFSSVPGKVTLDFSNTDKLIAGKIAELDFLSVVPDSNETNIFVSASDFTSDSVMFLDIIPLPTKSLLITSGKCNLTNLQYTGFEPQLEQNTPNPWSKNTNINFSISEKTPVYLNIYSTNGNLIKKLIDGKEYSPGNFRIIVSDNELYTGIYYYVLRTRTFYQCRAMTIIK